MKKIFSTIFMAVMLLSMTSCLGGTDNSYVKQEFSATMYNRVISGSDATLDQSVYNYILNYTNGALTVNGTTVVDGTTVTFTSDEMTLTYNSAYNAYGFSQAAFTNVSGGTVSSLTGYIDLNTMAIYIQYNANGKMVCSTSGLYYSSTSTYAYSPDSVSQDEFTSEKSLCKITLSSDTEKTATIAISDFSFDNTTAADGITVSIPNVPYEVTADGFTFAADKVTATNSGKTRTFELTNFKAVVTGQGLNVKITYRYKGRDVTITGKTYAPSTES